jgi:hypothetical protein
VRKADNSRAAASSGPSPESKVSDTLRAAQQSGARALEPDKIDPQVPVSGQALAFDPEEMHRIYAAGLKLGRSPDPWVHTPPASDQLGPWAVKLLDHIDRMKR